MNNLEYKNKTLNSIVNSIYDMLVFISCFVLVIWIIIIANWRGQWSKEYFLFSIPVLILVYHTIIVRVTRKDICNNINEAWGKE